MSEIFLASKTVSGLNDATEGSETTAFDFSDYLVRLGDGKANTFNYSSAFRAVILDGGNGADILRGGYDSDRLYGGEGDDQLYAGDSDDHLYGGIGDDILQGGYNNDVYYYNLGDGHDTITDISGWDWLILSSSITASMVSMAQASNDLVITIDDAFNPFNDGSITIKDYFTSKRIENVVFSDSTNFDIYNPVTQGRFYYGTDDADNLSGYEGSDVIYGMGGDDIIQGGGGPNYYLGNDRLYGGSGNDTIYLYYGDGYADGGADDDTIFMHLGNQTVYGGSGNDTVYVGYHGDILLYTSNVFLGDGDDIFDTDGNNCRMNVDGGAGNDLYRSMVGFSTRHSYLTINDISGNDVYQLQHTDAIITDLAGNDDYHIYLSGRPTQITIDDRSGIDTLYIDMDLIHYTTKQVHTVIKDINYSGDDLSFIIAHVDSAGNDKEAVAEFRCMSEIESQKVDWFWYPYMPSGSIVFLDGHPGRGKSFFTMWLAALCSNGGKFPFSDEKLPKGRVLILNAEDDPERTMRPRLEKAGADLSPNKIHFQGRFKSLTNDGLQTLEAKIISFKPDLVIIDPLLTYMGKDTDTNQFNQVTEFLTHVRAQNPFGILSRVKSRVIIMRADNFDTTPFLFFYGIRF